MNLDTLKMTSMGFNKTPIDDFSWEKFDVDGSYIDYDLCISNESLQSLYYHSEIKEYNTVEKIKMLKRLHNVYGTKVTNKNAKLSLESYLSDQIESTEGAIIASLVSLAIVLVVKCIKFVIKLGIWIVKTILHTISSIIAALTKRKKPEPKKVDNFIVKLLKKLEIHARGLDSWEVSTEDNKKPINKETSKPDVDLLKSIASYIKPLVKTNDDVKNISPEELLFYKVFLIDGNPKNIKYVFDVFNRNTTSIKEIGLKLNKTGAKLVLDTRPTKQNASKENLNDISTEDTRAEELQRLGEILVKSNIVDTRKVDYRKDMLLMVKGIQQSLINNEDILWMKKFYNIFNNGQTELKTITKDMEEKRKYLESIKDKQISDDVKHNIQIYNDDVKDFQKFMSSYAKCIQYFVKYYKIRSEIIQRFSSSISEWNESSAA
jgi:hypothetical protein